MATTRPNIVKSLVVNEVSLVDEPANPGAHAVLFKRREAGGPTEDSSMPKTQEELEKLTTTELAKGLSEAEKTLDTLTKAAETNTAAITAKDAEISKLKADLEKAKGGKTEPEGDDIFKGMTPAAIALFKKMQTDAEGQATELAKLRDKDENAEAINKAKADYPSAPATTPAELGPIMKRVASNKATAEDVTKLHQVLKASSVLVEKALESGERGTVVLKNGDGSAAAELVAKAAELRKADSKLTPEDAQAEVMKRFPELAARYRDEMQAPKRN